jgi:hypothetical protein
MWAFLILGLLFAAPAWAQSELKPPLTQAAPPESAALRGLVLSLQQIGVAAQQYVDEMNRQLAAKDARIAELEKLCGEPCKTGGK